MFKIKETKIPATILAVMLLVSSIMPVYANEGMLLTGEVYENTHSKEDGFFKVFNINEDVKNPNAFSTEDALDLVYNIKLGNKGRDCI